MSMTGCFHFSRSSRPIGISTYVQTTNYVTSIMLYLSLSTVPVVLVMMTTVTTFRSSCQATATAPYNQHPSSVEYRKVLLDLEESEGVGVGYQKARQFLSDHADRLDAIYHNRRRRQLDVHDGDVDSVDEMTLLADEMRSITHLNTAPKGIEYPVAYLFGGGAGAGKTGSAKILEQDTEQLTKMFSIELNNQNITFDNDSDDHDYVIINQDEIMELLPCYENDDSPCRATNSTWEAGEIADVFLEEAVTNRQNILLDGTFKSATTAEIRLELLQSQNYSLVVHLGVTRPTAVTASDAYDRGVRTNRWVPITPLVKTHTEYSTSFKHYTELYDGDLDLDDSYLGFDQIKLNRNLWPDSPDQVLIWADGKIEDDELYNSFLKKSNDTVESVLNEINNDTIIDMYMTLEKCVFNDRYCCVNWTNLNPSDEPYLSQISCSGNTMSSGSAENGDDKGNGDNSSDNSNSETESGSEHISWQTTIFVMIFTFTNSCLYLIG